MSSAPPQLSPSTEVLQVTTWSDPVIDLLGHDPRSPYVEQFWLPLLGPSTTFLLRHLAAGLDREPEGFELPMEATARCLGLGIRAGRRSPFLRALSRTSQFHLARSVGLGQLEVRRRVPPLTRAQVLRLPDHLQAAHQAWQQRENENRATSATADIPAGDGAGASMAAAAEGEDRRTRARQLARSLVDLGEPDREIEAQLHRWKVHPAIAHEALRWARAQQGGATTA